MKILNFYFGSKESESTTMSLLGVKGVSVHIGNMMNLTFDRFSEKLMRDFYESDQDRKNVKYFWYHVELDSEDIRGLSTPVRLSGNVFIADNFTTDFILSYLRRLSNLSLEEVLLMKASNEGVIGAKVKLVEHRRILDKAKVILNEELGLE